ncbi:MAG: flavodoxin family protein [Bacteroidetes bacterium]|nr:flavodoxin family protein [Bacteroidota bacterium]
MKTLIAYYSFTGNNAILAASLKERLGADLYEITEPRPRKGTTILLDILLGRRPRINPPTVNATRYDRVILVGPVWNAKIASPVASFLAWLKGKIPSYGYVTLCGGRDGQQEKMVRELGRIAGKPPLFVRQLALRDWLPEDRKANAKKGTSFKISAADLVSFRPAIDELVGELSQKTEKSML